jgi:hypothetical protein
MILQPAAILESVARKKLGMRIAQLHQRIIVGSQFDSGDDVTAIRVAPAKIIKNFWPEMTRQS